MNSGLGIEMQLDCTIPFLTERGWGIVTLQPPVNAENAEVGPPQ